MSKYYSLDQDAVFQNLSDQMDFSKTTRAQEYDTISKQYILI